MLSEDLQGRSPVDGTQLAEIIWFLTDLYGSSADVDGDELPAPGWQHCVWCPICCP
jgi:hypothetical protein